MRRSAVWAMQFASLALLSACNQEPDFDERFETAQQQAKDTAESIDAELQDAPNSSVKDE